MKSRECTNKKFWDWSDGVIIIFFVVVFFLFHKGVNLITDKSEYSSSEMDYIRTHPLECSLFGFDIKNLNELQFQKCEDF